MGCFIIASQKFHLFFSNPKSVFLQYFSVTIHAVEFVAPPCRAIDIRFCIRWRRYIQVLILCRRTSWCSRERDSQCWLPSDGSAAAAACDSIAPFGWPHRSVPIEFSGRVYRIPYILASLLYSMIRLSFSLICISISLFYPFRWFGIFLALAIAIATNHHHTNATAALPGVLTGSVRSRCSSTTTTTMRGGRQQPKPPTGAAL